MANRRTGLRYPATTPLPGIAASNGKTKSKKEAKVTRRQHQKASIPARLRRLPPPAAGAKPDKITYVLDTNVPLSDWTSLFNFDEHDVVIVAQVWRELDKQKKGPSDKAYNARRVISAIDKLVGESDLKPEEMQTNGIPLIPPENLETGNQTEPGNLFLDFREPKKPDDSKLDFDLNEPDDRILLACLELQAAGKRVVLVSRDGNFRVKASFAGITAEEYLSDAVVENDNSEENLSRGFHLLTDDFWDQLKIEPEISHEGDESKYMMVSPIFNDVAVNEFLLLPNGEKLFVREKITPQTVVAKTFHRYQKKVFGIKAQNTEQECAYRLLMDTNIPAVSIAGPAGSGKTILTLAAGLEQVKREIYNRIIFTRPTISAGEGIGFLPGDEKDKMLPWLGSLFDNLDIIPDVDNSKQAESGKGSTGDASLLQRLRIKPNAIDFMKGRTINNTFIIVDEAQDLNKAQLKMLLTRLGVGSKIVILGNVAQIDSNFLTEYSSAMSVFIRTFRTANLVGHITLQRGERHPFATLAEEML